MAVIQKQEAKVETSVERVRLELAGKIGRYVVHGNLYEKGTVYEFSKDVAERMLRLQNDEGIPCFRRWAPKPVQKRVAEGGARLVQVEDNKHMAELEDGNRIEIGTDDELIEAGIVIPTEDGDMSSADLAGHGVRVG